MLSLRSDTLLLLVTLFSLTVTVNSEIASWFTSGHHNTHHAQHDDKNATTLDKNSATPRPLHEILNVTKEKLEATEAHHDKGDGGVGVHDFGLNMNARDVSAAESATFATASAAPPPILQGGAYPPGAFPPMGGGFPGGLFPGLGGGAGLNVGLDAGIGGGFLGGIYPYFPIIEKVIVIVGGGILILIFLALLRAFLVKGGFVGDLGGFGDLDFAKSFAGAVDVNAGPFHASKAASGSIAFDQNAGLTQRVMNGVNTRW